MKTLVTALVLLASTTAGARPRRAVVTPIVTAGREASEAKLYTTIEGAIVDAAKKLGSIELMNFEGGKLKGPTRVDAKADPRPQARGQSLARQEGAELAIVAEPQALADGAVVYLQVVTTDGKIVGSTTVALAADVLHGTDLERPLRGGLVQILDPPLFVGRAELHVDVKGAEIDVDGRRPTTVGGGVVTLELPVGTHAVRVTHPAYHDYVRFIDVAFDRTTVENVALAAFPLTEGEMASSSKRGAPLRKVPWYRSWWALTITGAVLVGATTGIVFAARPGVGADLHTTYKAQPGP